MKQETIIIGFAQLGVLMTVLGKGEEYPGFSLGITKEEFDELNVLIKRQVSYNGWFTEGNVRQSLSALGEQLESDRLKNWVENYEFTQNPKSIGLIMAGNIPLVGFHDFLCVLISGNKVVCKLSSDDKFLLPALSKYLISFAPELESRITFSEGKIGEIDAVIATGSDNSLKYFEQYFGKYPHIFRRNRTSVAILNGTETEEDIKALGADIFSYFGLGCRNVSHLLIPRGFELNRFFEGILSFSEVINNNKYGNNYDYNKAVYLMNQLPLLDNNFVLLRESNELFSPLAMLHYHYYEQEVEAGNYLAENADQIQVAVGFNYTPFGKAQCPMLNDYADGVDVLSWLNEVNRNA